MKEVDMAALERWEAYRDQVHGPVPTHFMGWQVGFTRICDCCPPPEDFVTPPVLAQPSQRASEITGKRSSDQETL